MLTTLCLTTVASLGASPLAEESRAVVKTWLGQMVLAPNETHDQLVEFVRERIPPLVCTGSAEEWRRRSAELRSEVLDHVIFRGVPATWTDPKPQVKWEEAIETDKGYRIRKLRYEALPGLWIPALLYEPTDAGGKIPGVLNVNGHAYATGKAMKREQVRCINVAKRGMLALHPEWLNCGELHAAAYDHNRLAYLNMCGVSGVAVFYLAMKRGLDILADYPSADPARLAMTGLSGGGWQTIILSALDTRVAVSVPNAGYIGLEVRTEHLCDVGDLEQVPVDLVAIADYTHLTAMLAPRPALLLFNEKDDCCFQSYRAKPSVYDPVAPFYELFEKRGDFAFHDNKDPGTHNYEQDNREQFYRFVNRRFLPESEWVDEDIPSDDETLTIQKLRAGVPDGNANFFTLAEEQMAGLPVEPAPEPSDAAFATWQERARERLASVLRLCPMNAEGELQDELTESGVVAERYKLTVAEAWAVPVVVLTRADGAVTETVLVAADDGRAAVADEVAVLLAGGARVIVADILLMGECRPRPTGSWQLAMMIDSVGERILGQQAAQVRAIIEWAQRTFQVEQVALVANGRNAGIAFLAACGLGPGAVSKLSITGMTGSLKDLITERVPYNDVPALFCFGLLRHFDVTDLVALCRPVDCVCKSAS